MNGVQGRGDGLYFVVHSLGINFAVCYSVEDGIIGPLLRTVASYIYALPQPIMSSSSPWASAVPAWPLAEAGAGARLEVPK